MRTPWTTIAHLALAALFMSACRESVPRADAASQDVTCSSGQARCRGTCTNLREDPTNCGACGRTCSVGEVCSEGACAASCPERLTNCNGGCVDVMNGFNSQNCGECGRYCLWASCIAGRCCSVSSGCCALGQISCVPIMGVQCVDPASDPLHCGGCGRACAAGQTCTSGVCSNAAGDAGAHSDAPDAQADAPASDTPIDG